MPKANYNIICLPPGDDNIMYVSGHLPIKVCVYDVSFNSIIQKLISTTKNLNDSFAFFFTQADGEMITGMLGPDNGGLTVEQGYDAARHCGLNIIATLKKQLGDLDRVEQVVKVRYVQQ